MADFMKLGEENQVSSRTSLVANPGPGRLVILEVAPEPGISSTHEPITGIIARGAGDGGAGVRAGADEGDGIIGSSSRQFGVFGTTDGHGKAGVFGSAQKGIGVRGGGRIGILGNSLTADGDAEDPAGVFGVVGVAAGGDMAGVLGRHTGADGHGVRGEGTIGVFGTSSRTGSPAVWGNHSGEGFGVVGEAAEGQTAGVFGRHHHPDGQGVRGEGAIGVFGRSSATGFAAVAGDHSGEGLGVVGDTAAGDPGATAGVLGRHKGPSGGPGVRGEGKPGVEGICTAMGGSGGTEGPTGDFAGVRGKSSSGPGIFGAGRYGGQFRGTHAQLSIFPGTSAGRPTTGFHSKGEIYMDSEATLFVCVADGNPGTWLRVATEAA